MGATRSNGLPSLYNTMKRSTMPDVILKYYEGERPFTPHNGIVNPLSGNSGLENFKCQDEQQIIQAQQGRKIRPETDKLGLSAGRIAGQKRIKASFGDTSLRNSLVSNTQEDEPSLTRVLDTPTDRIRAFHPPPVVPAHLQHRLNYRNLRCTEDSTTLQHLN